MSDPFCRFALLGHCVQSVVFYFTHVIVELIRNFLLTSGRNTHYCLFNVATHVNYFKDISLSVADADGAQYAATLNRFRCRFPQVIYTCFQIMPVAIVFSVCYLWWAWSISMIRNDCVAISASVFWQPQSQINNVTLYSFWICSIRWTCLCTDVHNSLNQGLHTRQLAIVYMHNGCMYYSYIYRTEWDLYDSLNSGSMCRWLK